MESEKVKEIKKALEFCTSLKKRCRDCDYNEIGCYKLLKDILTLINDLEKENKTKTDTITDLLNEQEFYETEKLKQFGEMLKEKLEESNFINNGLWLVDTQVLIDETLKEFINES